MKYSMNVRRLFNSKVPYLVGGWTNPSENYDRQNGNLPQTGIKKESGRWWGCNFYEKITLKHRKLRCFMASTCLKPR